MSRPADVSLRSGVRRSGDGPPSDLSASAAPADAPTGVESGSRHLSFGLALALVAGGVVHVGAALLANAGVDGVFWRSVVSDLLLWVLAPTFLALAALLWVRGGASARLRARIVLVMLVVLLPVRWLHYGMRFSRPAVSAAEASAAERQALVEVLGDACRIDCQRDPGERSCTVLCRCVERETRRFSTDRLRNFDPDPDRPRTIAFIESLATRCPE